MEELVKYMKALVLLQLAAASGKEGETPNAVLLLSRAGLSNPDIATLLDKTLPAVQKAVQRGRK